ncbi:amidase [Actinocorallia longicatena]|uniref:amidase n=1 Tax=Actinocorallia longicatena TaxID=111803 RepID=UPI0031E1C835
MTEIHHLTALLLGAAVRRRELSPVEVLDYYLSRIEALNPQVGAYSHVPVDRAREQARRAEKILGETEDRASLPPLFGVPVPVKGLNMVNGLPTTFGSLAFDDLVGFADDHIVTLLEQSGNPHLGLTSTPEFGLPCYTENGVSAPARTPWDLSRSAGGSSGGAAAAVSSGLAPVAQGSDGGGSIRIPASVCGLFGFKPSRGRVSQGPVMPDLFGLSASGPLARTVGDAAALLDVLTGHLPGDLYRAPAAPWSHAEAAARPPGRLRIARWAEPIVPGAVVHPDVMAAYEDASALLDGLGHEIVDVPPIGGPELVPIFETLWAAMSTASPVPPEREHLLMPLSRWLRERGARITATELLRAHADLQTAVRAALAVSDAYDALLTPTLAEPPAAIGYFHDQEPAENFERQKRFTPFTALSNVSGQPSMSVPLHWTEDDLPIGVMLSGRIGEDHVLISLAAQIEQAHPWIQRRPSIW